MPFRPRLIWLPAAPIAAAAVFYLWHFSGLFLLIEYRHSIESDNSLAALLNWFIDVALLHAWSHEFSRATTWLAIHLIRSACGFSIPCHNVTQIGVLIASAAILGALLMRWRMRPILAALALLFFLFSTPLIDAAAWQATLLDKLALLFTALLTWYVARRPAAPLTLLDQLALLVLTILALNAKEAAWASVPALVLLDLVQSGQVWRTLARFALPVIYWAYQIGYTLIVRSLQSPDEMARVLSGHTLFNMHTYARDLVGPLLGLYGLIAILAVAAITAAAPVADRRDRMLVAWALVSFCAAMVIPLRTTSQVAFYLLVPLFYLTLVIALTATALTRLAGPLAAEMAAACILVSTTIGFARNYPYYAARIEMSRNFMQALAAVRDELSRAPAPRITFYYPTNQPAAYMFVQPIGITRHALARYLAPPNADLTSLHNAINDAPATATDPTESGEIAVRLRTDMSLESLTRGRQ